MAVETYFRKIGIDHITWWISSYVQYDSSSDIWYGTQKTYTVSDGDLGTGYVFDGWDCNHPSAAIINDRTCTLKVAYRADVTATVIRRVLTYVLSFDTGGGSSVDSVELGYFTTYELKPSSRTGYVFDGWSKTGRSGPVDYNAGDSVSKLCATDGGTVVLYAVWTPISYTVSFNANGGNGSMSSQSRTYDDGVALTSNSFTKTGHVFDGWATSSSGPVAFQNGTTANIRSTAGTTTLYAHWTPATYTVKFNANGGSGSMANQTKTYGVGKLSKNVFTRTGHSFVKWNTASDGSGTDYADEYAADLSTTSGATVNLYAIWSAYTCTVTFHANGGTGSMSAETFSYGTAKAITSNSFSRAGFHFGGWFVSGSASASVGDFGNSQYRDGETITLTPASNGSAYHFYAHWLRDVYVVKFDKNNANATLYNDARCVPSSEEEVASMVPHAEHFDALSVQTNIYPSYGKAAFSTLSGEMTLSNGLFTVNANNSGGSNPKYLYFKSRPIDYAVYGLSYTYAVKIETLTYHSGSGANIYFGNSYKNDGYAQLDYVSFALAQTGYLIKPVRCIKSKGEADYFCRGVISIPAGTNVSFSFRVAVYGGQGVSVSDTDARKSELVSLAPYRGVAEFNPNGNLYLPTPTLTNYNLTGWFTASSGGTSVNAKTRVSGNANMTLYAHYAGKPYYVSKVVAGGSAVADTVVYDEEYTPSAPTPPNGFEFVGWRLSNIGGAAKRKVNGAWVSADTSTLYANGTTFVNLQNAGSTATLTAKWRRIRHTVTLNDAAGAGHWAASVSCDSGTFTEYDTTNNVDVTINPGAGLGSVGTSRTFTFYRGCQYKVTLEYAYQSTQGDMKFANAYGGFFLSCDNESNLASQNARLSVSHTMSANDASTVTWTPWFTTITSSVVKPERIYDAPTVTKRIARYNNGKQASVTASAHDSLDFQSFTVNGDTSHVYTDNPHLLDVSGSSMSVSAAYSAKSLNVSASLDPLSAAAVSGSEPTVSGSGSVEYGSNATVSITGIPATYSFGGWYDGNGNLVGSAASYTVQNVTANVTLVAKLVATFTVQTSGACTINIGSKTAVSQGGSATMTSISESVVIGGVIDFGASPAEGKFFSSWTKTVGGSEQVQDIPASVSGYAVLGNTTLTANIVGAEEVRYVAVYCNNGQAYSNQLASFSATGSAVAEDTSSNYGTAVISPLGEGRFFKVTGTQNVVISMNKTTQLSWLGATRADIARGATPAASTRGERYAYSCGETFSVLVNQDFDLVFDFGEDTLLTCTSSLSSAEDAANGEVDLANDPREKSMSGISASGKYRVGTFASVVARAKNGRGFSGWYADRNTAMTQAPTFSPQNSYSAGDVVKYGGLHYKFNTSHSGTWEAGHVDAVSGRFVPKTLADTEAFSESGTYQQGEFVKHDGEVFRCSVSHDRAAWNSSHFVGRVSPLPIYEFQITSDTILYARFDRASVSLYKWEGGSENKTMRWTSKTYSLSKPANMTSIRLDATKYPVERVRVSSFSSPDTATANDVDLPNGIVSQTVKRLPTRRPERYFSVSVESSGEVDAIIVGTSGEGIAT